MVEGQQRRLAARVWTEVTGGVVGSVGAARTSPVGAEEASGRRRWNPLAGDLSAAGAAGMWR